MRALWVFDRPLLRDPLFLLAVVAGVVAEINVLAHHDRYGSSALVFTVVTLLPASLLAFGVVGGSLRNFVRARR